MYNELFGEGKLQTKEIYKLLQINLITFVKFLNHTRPCGENHSLNPLIIPVTSYGIYISHRYIDDTAFIKELRTLKT